VTASALTEPRRSQLSGGRELLRRGGRVVLWLVIALVGVAGVRALLAGPAEPTASPVATPAADPVQTAAAQQLAAAVVADLYSFSGGDPTGYRAGLSRYGPAGSAAADAASLSGASLVASVLPGAVRPTPGGLVVDITAKVISFPAGAKPGTLGPASTGWRAVQVPLAVTPSGLALTGAPAPTALPAIAVPPEAAPGPPDAPAAELRPAVERMLSGYATDDLDYLLVPGTSLPGLGGSVRLASLTGMSVRPGQDPNARQIDAAVLWIDRATGSRLTAGYTLNVRRLDGRWYLAGLRAGPLPSSTG